MQPVQLLYHGTNINNVQGIEEKGLVSNNNVYLTTDLLVAYDYAKKNGDPVICIVDSLQMVKDGFVFSHDVQTAEYTINHVPSNYIIQIVIESEADLFLIDYCTRYTHDVAMSKQHSCC